MANSKLHLKGMGNLPLFPTVALPSDPYISGSIPLEEKKKQKKKKDKTKPKPSKLALTHNVLDTMLN
jgi:hypothetical protein